MVRFFNNILADFFDKKIKFGIQIGSFQSVIQGVVQTISPMLSRRIIKIFFIPSLLVKSFVSCLKLATGYQISAFPLNYGTILDNPYK